jgi:hypothetical protein
MVVPPLRGCYAVPLLLMMLCLACRISFAFPAVTTPFSLCWNGDSDCPPCNATHNNSAAGLLLLADSVELVLNAQKVQQQMRQFPGIIWLQPLIELHTSLLYLCCYSDEQMLAIQTTLQHVSWPPLLLNYSAFGCNVDADGIDIWVHFLADTASQAALYSYVGSLQDALEKVS